MDGAGIGDTLRLSAAGTVEVHAWAESILPIHTLQLVQQGRVIAQVDAARGDAPEGRRRLELRETVRVDGHSWLAARVGGPDYGGVQHHDGWQRGIFAHTSPVYLAVGGEWWMFNRATAEYMLTLIDGCLSYVRHSRAAAARRGDHLPPRRAGPRRLPGTPLPGGARGAAPAPASTRHRALSGVAFALSRARD